jgi:hypothetical protein
MNISWHEIEINIFKYMHVIMSYYKSLQIYKSKLYEFFFRNVRK